MRIEETQLTVRCVVLCGRVLHYRTTQVDNVGADGWIKRMYEDWCAVAQTGRGVVPTTRFWERK
jgi:hypothetical protein